VGSAVECTRCGVAVAFAGCLLHPLRVIPTAILVRPAAPSDVDTLATFNVAMAFETEQIALDPGTVRRGVAAVLADPAKGSYRVATRAGAVVGQLMITTEWSDWRCGFWWWIQSVYVAADARRGGVYRALHRSVLEDAERAGDVRGVRLYVEQENTRAQRAYEALGMARGRYLVFETGQE
jgi:ribosomal protein S18 acetylase RimI-like enzyme